MVSLRCKELWQQRRARRARANAERDAAKVEGNRDPNTEPWTPEMYARLLRMLRDDESA